MKKFLSFFFALFLSLTLAACTSSNQGDNNGGEPLSSEALGIKFHYNRSDGAYSSYSIWIWESGGTDGADYYLTSTDDYGGVYQVSFDNFTEDVITNGLGFIVKEAKTWAEGATKDYDKDRFIDFSTISFDKYGYYNVYLKKGDEKIYSDASGKVADMITTFGFANDANNNLLLMFITNTEYESFVLKCGSTVLASSETKDTDSHVTYTKTGMKYKYSSSEVLNVKGNYTVEIKFKESQATLSATASLNGLYSSSLFNSKYSYDGELGAIYSHTSTTFKVWSPVSTAVKLRIYETGTPASITYNNITTNYSYGSNTYKEYEMTEDSSGVWSKTLSGDLEGKYYTYAVTNASYTNKEVVDPYAKSTGINGLRGMIVDFDKTNPEGWDEVEVNDYSANELVVYETHIEDLTASSTWGGSASYQRKYLGFCEEGTTYEGVTTGFDHIKELGVNAVQIMPFYDQANDERPGNQSYNWGYNPLNYNSLEGQYSSNPFDGYARIKEFKQLVKAYNNAGINIIMDVVYNHVNGAEGSNFDVLMPGYYFRYDSTGSLSNGSGCGNEVATEMTMMRKFIVDSTEFLAEEYKLGGYRFDLMGCFDTTTMNRVTTNLKENVNSSIVVYGEPWSGGTISLSSNYTPANTSNGTKFNGYGMFNDKMRDALIKGGLSAKTDLGWITQTGKQAVTDMNSIKAGIKGTNISASGMDVSQCVNYVTCHDNYTLYDRIKAAGITDEATIKKMAMLANSVVLTSQGISFIQSGEEFLRTKGGNSNSYNAGYSVNAIDYSLKVKNIDMFENYKKLIALKTSGTVFSLNTADASNIDVTISSDNSMISYKIISGDKEYYIIHVNGTLNASNSVNLEGYTLYLDTLNSGVSFSSSTALAGYQTIIAYRTI